MSTFLSSLTLHEYFYYISMRHNGTFMCNIISSIIVEEIINSVQLFQAFDMHHRISYWIFHIKHKNQERRPSGDKEALQSGCYVHDFTKSNKKDREKHGHIEILIKKTPQIPAVGKKDGRYTQKRRDYYGEKI